MKCKECGKKLHYMLFTKTARSSKLKVRDANMRVCTNKKCNLFGDIYNKCYKHGWYSSDASMKLFGHGDICRQCVKTYKPYDHQSAMVSIRKPRGRWEDPMLPLG